METITWIILPLWLGVWDYSAEALLKKNSTPSHEHRLIKQLFKYYDPSVRPRYDSSETVNVKIRFSLQQINDLDEKRQILKLSGWITAEWLDEFLTWDPDKFGGLTKMVVDPKKLWVPKLAIGNSANKLFDGEHYKRFWITVRSDGQCRWQPGGVFAISCALDMNFYPFDDQTCTIEIETWVYTADKVNLSSSLDRVGLDTYIPHGEWTIIKTHVESINLIYRYYLTESFPEVYFTIYMRRKYTFYFMYILLPCLMLSGVLLMIFLVPADSGEKVSLGVSVLVAISVFLLLVSGNVPDTSDAIPIIAIYLTYFMMATTLAVTFSVLVIRFHFKSPEEQAPQWLRVLLFNYMARMMRLDDQGKYSRLVASSRKRHPAVQRDLTWSDTLTEDIRSQNSHAGTLSPGPLTPDGPDEMELLHHRRRMLADTSGGGMDHNSVQCGRDQSISHHMHTFEHHPGEAGGGMGSTQPPAVNEWKQMAEILDRFFFWLFLFLLIVPTTTILGLVRLFKPPL